MNMPSFIQDETMDQQESDDQMQPVRTPDSLVSGYIFGAIKIGLSLLGARALLVMAFLGGLGLFLLAMLEPEREKIATAVLYAVTVFLPILYRKEKSK